MSTTITVTSAAELNQALSQATGGETILLAAGDYGRLNIKTKFASNVTIKSADPNAQAEISELKVTGASNITFEDVVFDYTFNGEAKHYQPFKIQNSSNITIKDSTFDGDLSGGYGTGYGLDVRGSSNVVVENNEFYDWHNGITAHANNNLSFVDNNIHSIHVDGIYLDNNQGIHIEGNYLHDFDRPPNSGAHSDFIQISKVAGPSSDIVIRGNVLDTGSGDWVQAIFMGNSGKDPSDPAYFHTNILIEDNMIYNAHTHGISLGSAQDVTISNNTVLAVPGQLTGSVSIPAIRVGGTSQNVTIEQNVVSNVFGHNGQSSWDVSGNVYVQNTKPGAANYYDDVFTVYATGAQDGYNQFGVTPGSVIDTTGAGSDLAQQFPVSYDKWVGTSTTGSNTGTTTPDTGTTTPNTGPTTPDTGTTRPDTGTTTPDTGTTRPDTGTTTPDTGTTTPDTGTTPPDTGTAIPDAGQPLEMVFDDYILNIANLPGSEQADLKGDTYVADTGSGPALQFDGNDDYVKLGRLDQFEDSGQIAFTIDYARDEADGSKQRLVWNHTKIGLTLSGDGVVAKVANNDDKFHKGFKSGSIGLNDTETHTITLLVDEDADRLQVIVDGEVVIDESDVDFDFTGGREHGWSLGTAWGRDVDGEISAFAIDDEVQFVDTSVPYDAPIA